MLAPAGIPMRLRILVENELRSGEKIVWLGQPNPGRASRSSLPIFIFGIPWTAFSLFWTGMAATMLLGNDNLPFTGFSVIFPLFGLPFIAVGLGMLSSPYWMKKRALNTVYVITNQRAIIFNGGWTNRKMSVNSYTPDQLRNPQRTQREDRSGSLIFLSHSYRDSDGDRRSHREGFFEIPDVKAVEELLLKLAQSHASPIPL